MTEIRNGQPQDVQRILDQVMRSIAEKRIREAHIRKDTNTVINMPMTKGA